MLDEGAEVVDPLADVHGRSLGDVLIIRVIKGQEYLILQVLATFLPLRVNVWQV